MMDSSRRREKGAFFCIPSRNAQNDHVPNLDSRPPIWMIVSETSSNNACLSHLAIRPLFAKTPDDCFRNVVWRLSFVDRDVNRGLPVKRRPLLVTLSRRHFVWG